MISSNQKDVLFFEISKYIKEYSVSSLLDIGAGDGVLANRLSKIVEKYVAVEEDPINIAKLAEKNINVIGEKFPVEMADLFDMVLSSHSIPEDVKYYPPFLETAWKRVIKNGVLLIITFKGEMGPIRDLAEELRGKDNIYQKDDRLFEVMVKMLKEFGEVKLHRVNSKFMSESLSEMCELVSNSLGGDENERNRYEERLKKILQTKYRDNAGFFFPFEHVFLSVKNRQGDF